MRPVLGMLLLPLSLAVLTAAEGDPYAKLENVTVEHYAPFKNYSEGPTWRDGEVFFCGGAPD